MFVPNPKFCVPSPDASRKVYGNKRFNQKLRKATNFSNMTVFSATISALRNVDECRIHQTFYEVTTISNDRTSRPTYSIPVPRSNRGMKLHLLHPGFLSLFVSKASDLKTIQDRVYWRTEGQACFLLFNPRMLSILSHFPRQFNNEDVPNASLELSGRNTVSRSNVEIEIFGFRHLISAGVWSIMMEDLLVYLKNWRRI